MNNMKSKYNYQDNRIYQNNCDNAYFVIIKYKRILKYFKC